MLPVSYIRRIFMEKNKTSKLMIFILGKTTILYKLKLGEIVTTIPTIGKSDILFVQIF